MKRLALAVLAAGASQRFGDRDKLLTHCRGKPLIAHALETFSTAAFARRIVVLPEGEDTQLADLCQQHGFETLENTNAESGIASSIARATEACYDCDGLMIALADMPQIEKTTIAALSSAFQGSGDDAIIAPEFDNRRGHPVIFGKAHIPALAKLRGDQGAASVIKDHAGSYSGVSVNDDGVLIDFDTPADFQRR